MGYTRQLGQLAYLITYDGSGNITVPASLTQGSVTSSMLKTDGSGKLVAAVAGTDFVAPAGLSSYVPTSRTITINGTAYDLSADRSWSIVSGVSSFNTRTGAIELGDTDVTGALGYTPVTNARTITINGTTYDLSADRSWSIVAGISSFNTRTGDITLLDTDVTGALGYTPVTNARTITINGTTYDLSANRTWVVDASSVTTRVIQKFTATSNQTEFTITGGYTVGMVDVFLNGIKLDNAVDFTAIDGSVVTLAVGAATGDIVEVYKYGGQFIANNTLRQSTLFTATAGQTTFTVNYSVGFVDVFYNGSKLDSSEFTATNGTSIVLGTACVLNDKVEVVAYNYTVGAFTGVGGSGTAGKIAKWTATGTLNNSLIYDNGTNIGINTTTPIENFDVKGNIGITSIAGSGNQLNIYSNNQSNNNITLAQGWNTGTDNVGYLYNRASADFVFGVGNVEKLRITTTNILRSQGLIELRPTGANQIALNSVGTNYGFVQNNSDGSWSLGYGPTTGTIGTPVLTWLSTGKVGIANTNPNYNLTVDAVANDAISWRNRGTEVGRLGIEADTSNGWLALFNSGVTKVQLTAGPGNSWVASNGGYFGIGTNSPQGKFHVDHEDAYHMGIQHNKTGTYVTETKFGRPSTGSNISLIYDIAGTEIAEFKRNYSGAKMIFTKESTTHMEISSGGVVTIPLQPSFSIGVSSNVTGPSVVAAGRLIFNNGGYYNTSTYRFTAPVTGKYFFSFYDNIFPNDTNPAQFYFRVNGTRRGAIAYTLNKGTSWYLISFQQVISLNAGDYVDVYNQSNDRPDYGSDDGWGNFSGYLIG